MAPCKWCKRPILWAISDANRKPLPVNPDPDPTGNLVVVANTDDGKFIMAVSGVDCEDGRPRYMPHFATCPNRPRRTR